MPVVDMASFNKPEPVTSMDKFFYGELVIRIEVRFFFRYFFKSPTVLN
jgi:hypothetical protein